MVSSAAVVIGTLKTSYIPVMHFQVVPTTWYPEVLVQNLEDQ